MFRRLSREPTKYVAIEPTKAHAEQLLSNLSSAKFPHSVHVEAFTTDFECSEQFDLIILPHCMYCIPNAEDILKHCSTMLAEGGKLLVYIQTTVGVFEFYNHFLPKLDFSDAPFQNHLVTDESLSKIMNDLGMNHTVHYEASHLLLGDSKPSTDIDLMLNFFLMTEIRSLPSPMYDEVYDLLAQKRIKVDGEDGYKLSHPSAVLVHRR